MHTPPCPWDINIQVRFVMLLLYPTPGSRYYNGTCPMAHAASDACFPSCFAGAVVFQTDSSMHMPLFTIRSAPLLHAPKQVFDADCLYKPAHGGNVEVAEHLEQHGDATALWKFADLIGSKVRKWVGVHNGRSNCKVLACASWHVSSSVLLAGRC